MVGDGREGVALELVQDATDGELALAQRQNEPPQLGGRAASLLLRRARRNMSNIGRGQQMQNESQIHFIQPMQLVLRVCDAVIQC